MASATQRAGLLRPPAHRGPLIAAGAVVLATGLALEELRLGDRLASGVHLLVLAGCTALVAALGLRASPEGTRPPAYQSVLLVTGLLLLAAALLRLADVLGAGPSGALLPLPPAGTLVWTSLLLALAAGWTGATRRSAVCLLIAAIAAGICVLAALRWIFGADSQGPYRAVLLGLALVLVLASLVLRGGAPRQAQQLVNAAGLAVLAIPVLALLAAVRQLLSLFGGSPAHVLPGFWELVVLACGCGLIAYGAVDRVPGAAYLGFANLVAFILVAAIGEDQTLLWWPLLLILLGGGAMAAGLRPLRPLPPEPDPYRAGEQPLAARTEDEIRLSVRDDSPPG